jgi:CxxC-x17-CxxC domain-containing protein
LVDGWGVDGAWQQLGSAFQEIYNRAVAEKANQPRKGMRPKFFNSKESLCAKNELGCTISTRTPMAGDIQLTCSDCGQDFTFTAADQAFFQERGYSTPKRCKNCRQAKKNDQGGSGYRSAPAQGTPVICSGCGQPTTVPFEPRGDRPVFCRDCYQARKGSGGGGGGSSRGRGRF